MENNPNYQNYCTQKQDFFMILYGLARCINGIIVSVGCLDIFRNDSVRNPTAFQKWNSSKGKQYILFKDNLNFE